MPTATKNTLDLAAAIKQLGGKPVKAAQMIRTVSASATLAGSGVWIPPTVQAKLMLAVNSGRHIWVYGPPGTGKSTILLSILQQRTQGQVGKDYFRFTMDASKTADDLVGVLGPDDNGGFKHSYSSLITACEQGKPCVIDEINAIRPEHSFPFFSMLDHTKEFDALLAGKTKHVLKSDGFQVLATANDNGTGDKAHLYGGIELTNRALAERFAYYVYMDYLPPVMETEMIREKTGLLDATLLEGLVEIAGQTRKVAKDDPSRAELAISPRVLLEWSSAYVLAAQTQSSVDHIGLAELAVTGRLSESVKDTIHELVRNKLGRIVIKSIAV